MCPVCFFVENSSSSKLCEICTAPNPGELSSIPPVPHFVDRAGRGIPNAAFEFWSRYAHPNRYHVTDKELPRHRVRLCRCCLHRASRLAGTPAMHQLYFLQPRALGGMPDVRRTLAVRPGATKARGENNFPKKQHFLRHSIVPRLRTFTLRTVFLCCTEPAEYSFWSSSAYTHKVAMVPSQIGTISQCSQPTHAVLTSTCLTPIVAANSATNVLRGKYREENRESFPFKILQKEFL